MPRTTIRSEDITAAQVKTADMAVDPTNASNLSSGSVPLAQLGNAPETDLGPTEDDIAVLGFQVAAASDLAKYSLRDQIVDTFQDATGVDASASTNEVRDATGKYYEGGSSITPTVTGGTITTDGAYTVHKFLTGANLVTDTAQSYDVLVVGGGGGAGRRHGGGGGAGGLIYISGYSVTAATHAVVVGAGGTGATNSSGASATNGADSTFMNLTALGGGVGASDSGSHNVNTGGSGGGGDNLPTPAHWGQAAQPSTNDGHANSGFGNDGAGGANNTGGGGGGDGSDDSPGAAGGSGIVILRRPTVTTTIDNMTLVSTATTAEAGTTATGDLVILYTPQTGSTVLNTNLKAYVSRDNGTTYTQATLVGKGSYSGTTQIASTHDLDISAQPAGTSMRWKIETLVQSAALVTRINGVSLGWS